jgi:hypothetical protein
MRRLSPVTPRVLVAVCAVSVVISLGALSLAVAIVAAPHYWFAGAFAEKGPTGDRGPRGPIGAVGAAGPIGPDAQSAIDDLSYRLDDLETGSGDQSSLSVDDLATRVDDLATKIDDLETGTGDQANSSVDDLATTITGLCDAVASNNLYDVAEAFGSFINDLDAACP